MRFSQQHIYCVTAEVSTWETVSHNVFLTYIFQKKQKCSICGHLKITLDNGRYMLWINSNPLKAFLWTINPQTQRSSFLVIYSPVSWIPLLACIQKSSGHPAAPKDLWSVVSPLLTVPLPLDVSRRVSVPPFPFLLCLFLAVPLQKDRDLFPFSSLMYPSYLEKCLGHSRHFVIFSADVYQHRQGWGLHTCVFTLCFLGGLSWIALSQLCCL